MSTTTDVLSLFKYDPVADADSTFNITQALNNNWDKLDAAILLAIAAAGAYNPEESYAVGDYCTYKGKLRKCSTAIPTGETWTEAHWTTTTVAAELAELSSQLSNKVACAGEPVPLGTNILTLAPGRYSVDQVPNTEMANKMNLPVTGWHYEIDVLAAINATGLVSNHKVIIVYPRTDVVLPYINIMNYEGNWTGWTLISTATPPEEYDIPFRSGWQANGMKATYCKSQEGICIVNCAVYGTGTASDNFIASLPEGFHPSGTICCAAHAYKDGVRGIAEAQIMYNGDIVIYSPIEFDYVSFSCAFVAGN